MDRHEFDRLTRRFATGLTRRGALGLIGGAVFASMGSRRASAQVVNPGGPGLTGWRCGGGARLPCPPGYVCAPTASGCDPAGPDGCPGTCQPEPVANPCDLIRCASGTVCCDACGGHCIPDGTDCSLELCSGVPCGTAVCGQGEYCCNDSCSRCAPIGAMCTMEFCGGPVPCGDTTCAEGEQCCSASCGICGPIGGACPMIECANP